MMKYTLRVSKLKFIVFKIEIQLKQEKVENKIHQQQIKRIKGDLLTMDSEINRGKASNKILVEKENTIQLLRNKLKIPATQLCQAPELTKLEK